MSDKTRLYASVDKVGEVMAFAKENGLKQQAASDRVIAAGLKVLRKKPKTRRSPQWTPIE